MENKLLKIAAFSLLAIAIMFAVLLGFSFSHHKAYQKHHHYYGQHHEFNFRHKLDKMLDEADVTPEQKAQLDDIIDKAKDEQKPIIHSMFEKKKELIDYMAKPDSEKETAFQMKQEITDLHNEIAKIHINAIYEMKKVLKQEQIEKLAKCHKEKLDKIEKKITTDEDDDNDD
ncbi:MAG: Spy/CpxP family protein refolding chaperone [Candidatus Gastranaerophilales bacterium]|nr:Spy/CpxP family protein refolding chaperone [Candidatus Gastranaerophilales bacterium]